MLLQIMPSLGDWFNSTGMTILTGFMVVMVGFLFIIGPIAGVFWIFMLSDAIFFSYPAALDPTMAWTIFVGVIVYFALMVILMSRTVNGPSSTNRDAMTLMGILSAVTHAIILVLVVYSLGGLIFAIIAGIGAGFVTFELMSFQMCKRVCISIGDKDRCLVPRNPECRG